MKIDFLDDKCLTITRDTRFGICDDDDKQPAYVNKDVDERKWIAKIDNAQGLEVWFRAIDNCIALFREKGEMISRCDAMLTYEGTIVFIELKDKVGGWKAEGIAQIEETLRLFIENHGDYYYSFKKKRAFIANRRHPNFHVIENETMRRFSSQFGIWLGIRATIKVS